MTRSGVLNSDRRTSIAFRVSGWRFRALEHGGGWPVVLNAANEVAVHAFLEGRLPFTGIPKVMTTP